MAVVSNQTHPLCRSSEAGPVLIPITQLSGSQRGAWAVWACASPAGSEMPARGYTEAVPPALGGTWAAGTPLPGIFSIAVARAVSAGPASREHNEDCVCSEALRHVHRRGPGAQALAAPGPAGLHTGTACSAGSLPAPGMPAPSGERLVLPCGPACFLCPSQGFPPGS